MNKPKLLAWCDFIKPSGFGIVAMNLLNDMHNYYDVSVVGINYLGIEKYDLTKYFVYPISEKDRLGKNIIVDVAKKEQPDIIFLFQDIFNINEIIENIKAVSPNSKIVIYFPIDGKPFCTRWMKTLKIADIIITYTDWAISVIKDAIPNIDKPIYKLYHGVDTEIFKPLSQKEIIKLRRALNWNKKFTIINVNRYQPRKGIALTMRAYSMFAKGYSYCTKCGNYQPIHIKRCDLNNCDENYLEKHPDNKRDIYLYSHMMISEQSMGSGYTNSLIYNSVSNGFNTNDYNSIIGFNGKRIYDGEVTHEELNKLYNGANINISASVGEGFGLSLIESQATGTKSIAPNNSAIPEVLNNTGYLLQNKAIWFPQFDNNFARPIIDAFTLTEKLNELYYKWKKTDREIKTIDQKCIDNVNKNFLWKDKKEFLINIFNSVLNNAVN